MLLDFCYLWNLTYKPVQHPDQHSQVCSQREVSIHDTSGANLDPSDTEMDGHMFLPYITWVDIIVLMDFIRLPRSNHQRGIVAHRDVSLIYTPFCLISLLHFTFCIYPFGFLRLLPRNTTCIQIFVSETYFKRIQFSKIPW